MARKSKEDEQKLVTISEKNQQFLKIKVLMTRFTLLKSN